VLLLLLHGAQACALLLLQARSLHRYTRHFVAEYRLDHLQHNRQPGVTPNCSRYTYTSPSGAVIAAFMGHSAAQLCMSLLKILQVEGQIQQISRMLFVDVLSIRGQSCIQVPSQLEQGKPH
jgi:hypothetical protein